MLIAQRINKGFSLLKIKRNDINNKTQYFLFIWLFIHCLCGKIYWNSFCFRCIPQKKYIVVAVNVKIARI